MFSKGTHLTFISMSCACVFVCGYLSVLEAIEDGSKPFKRNQLSETAAKNYEQLTHTHEHNLTQA